ncbi:hypothetical protein BHM03_00047713, partial [Ensete ventricosum]
RGRIILLSKGCPSPLAPSASPLSLSPLPLRRRQLPLPIGSRPAKGRPPLRLALAPSPLLATGLAVGGNPLRASYSRPPLQASRCKRLCPRPTTAPCERHWPPLRAGRPCMGAVVAGRPSLLPSLRKCNKNA